MSDNHAARLLTVFQTLRKYTGKGNLTLAQVWFRALDDEDSPLSTVVKHFPTRTRAFPQAHYTHFPDSWSADEERIYPHVAEYSKLVWASRRQASVMAEAGIVSAQRALTRDDQTRTWSLPFFPADHGFHNQTVVGLSSVSSTDYKALRRVAEGWRQIEPLISTVPTVGDRRKLRDEVHALIGLLLADEALDTPLRDALVQSLHDILWAIDHWIATGSEGVKAACERLGFQLVSEEGKGDTGLRRVWVTLKKIWVFASLLSDLGGAHQTLAGIGDSLMLDP